MGREEDGEERATLRKGEAMLRLAASWVTGFSWSRRGRGWGDRCWRCQGSPLVVSSPLLLQLHRGDGSDVDQELVARVGVQLQEEGTQSQA